MDAFEWVDYHAFGASIGGELSWLSTTVGIGGVATGGRNRKVRYRTGPQNKKNIIR